MLVDATTFRVRNQLLPPNELVTLADDTLLMDPTRFTSLMLLMRHASAIEHLEHEHPVSRYPGIYLDCLYPRRSLIKHTRAGLVGSSRALNDVWLHIDEFSLHDKALPGSGTLAIALCAVTAYRVGLSRITVIAAGPPKNPGRVGYLFFPRMDFDAPLSMPKRQNMGMNGRTTLLQALKRDAGRWDAAGIQRLMTFDLRAYSQSWKSMISQVNRRRNLGLL